MMATCNDVGVLDPDWLPRLMPDFLDHAGDSSTTGDLNSATAPESLLKSPDLSPPLLFFSPSSRTSTVSFRRVPSPRVSTSSRRQLIWLRSPPIPPRSLKILTAIPLSPPSLSSPLARGRPHSPPWLPPLPRRLC
ncbi:hypothetical protein Droror1_Dr00026668 [Drosera rotundifolia]